MPRYSTSRISWVRELRLSFFTAFCAAALTPNILQAQTLDHFTWSTLPNSVQPGQGVAVSIEARDINNVLVPNYAGQVTLSQVGPGANPTILLTEIETINTERVELSNFSTNPVNLSGWQVLLYDNASWPGPDTVFTFPAGAICPGQGVFELRDVGVPPGAYPAFYIAPQLTWNNSFSRNQQAVVLVDAFGKVVDFFCAVDAYPQLMALPFPLTADLWSGFPVAVNGNPSFTYQRIGSANHHNAADWKAAANSFGSFNPGLQLPFASQPRFGAVQPTSVTFSGGTWMGLVTVNVPATNAVVRADDLAGHSGDSAPFTVLALPALTLQAPHQSFKATPGYIGDATVTLPLPLSSNLNVTLSSALTNHIQVPASITIPAGATGAAFGVTNLDDGLMEGPQPVLLNASAPGFASAGDTVTNYDRPVTLSVTLPTNVFETAGWNSGGQLRASGFVSAPVLVSLTSSDTNRLRVPDFTVLGPGQDSAPLTFTPVDNPATQGDEAVTITASVPGWTGGQGQIIVRDIIRANPTLWVALPNQVWEGSGWLSNAGLVHVTSPLPTNVIMTLASDMPAKLQVPISVVLPAGQYSNVFDVFVPNNPVAEPDQVVTVTPTAPGFRTFPWKLTVLDNQLAGFAMGALPPAQACGQPFTLSVTALNLSGSTPPGFAGTLSLTARGFAGPATVLPATLGPFTNGNWNTSVTIPAPNRGLVLTANDGAGHTVSSTPFDVVPDRTVTLSAADLAYDALRNQVLAGVIANSSSTGQCLVPIDPDTGALSPAIPLGADPQKLALADDCSYVYAAMANNSTGGVVRVNLSARAVDLRFPLGTLNMYGQQVNWVEDMKVQPGHPHTLVATARIQDAYNQYIAIYDDGVMRPNTVSPVYYVRTYHLTFGNSPDIFYITKPNGMWVNSITSSGATFLQEIQGAAYGADMVFGGGNLYAVSGDVFDTNNFALVGSFPTSGLVIPDTSRGRVYFLTQDSSQTKFVVFEQATFQKLAELALPGVSGQVGSFVQCGSNSFAFQTTGGQVHLLETSMLYTNANADLSLRVQTAPAQPMVGGNLTYTVTLSNAGPATSFGVRLTNQVPALSSFVSVSSSVGSCAYTNGGVTCALGDLVAGTTVTVTIVVQPTAGGSVVSAFTVDALTVDQNPDNNNIVISQSVGVDGGGAPVSPLSLLANHMVYDPATQLIFATVPPAAIGLSNCLVSLNPLTGQIGTPLFVGRQPNRLAIAPGGRDLYIGLDGDYAVRRYDTVSQTLYPPFSLGANTVAIDLAVRPGAPQTVAVSRWVPSVATFADVALYDNGVQRPAIVHSPHIQFSPDGALLYGSGWNGPNWINTSSDAFYISQVIPTGLTNIGGASLTFNSNLEMQMGGGLAYYPPGLVLDPATGVLLNPAFIGIGYAPLMRVDVPGNRVFFVFSDSQNWFLQQFNLTTRALEASRVLPALAADPRDLILWGTSGLAFRNDAGQIFLVQIPALPPVPQLAVSTSASPAVGTLGANFDYTIIVTNRGPITATNVVLTDLLPTGALFAGASSSQGSVTQSPGTVVFSLGNLSNGASATLHLLATPGFAGWNVNTNYATAVAYDLSSGAIGSVSSNWVNLASGNRLTNQFLIPGLSALAYDGLNQMLYGSVNGAGGALSNCIVGIDARTGALRSQLALVDGPGRLALSDDSHYLYVALTATGGVARVDLWSNAVDLRFALGENDRFGNYGAGDLKVVPGQPQALAVSINHGQSNEGVKIYDNGVARTNASPGSIYGGVYWIDFGASSSVLYSAFPVAFRTIQVDATGATLLSEDANLVPGYDSYFDYDSGKVFFNTGRIIDPVAKTTVGQLPISGLVAPDVASGLAYFLTTAGYAPFNYQLSLRAFDLGSSNELWSVTFPVANGSGTQLLKCGTNGLAVLTDAGNLFLVQSAALGSPAADLSVSQAAPALASAGAPITFVYTVQNTGPWTASGVVVSNPLPAGATFFSATSSQGSCTFANGAVLASLGLLTNNCSATMTVKYAVPVGGSLTNVATVWHTMNDPNPANNSTGTNLIVLPQPGVVIRDTNVVQGLGSKSAIVFNLSLTGPCGAPVTVNYQTSNGSAVAGLDYDAASGIVIFPTGTTNVTLGLNIIRPTVSALSSRSFFVNLSSPTNAFVARPQAAGTIITRNYLTVYLANANVVEGNAGVTNAQFKLSLNATSAVPVAVQYQTVSGTATPGSDYQPRSGTVVLPAGTTNFLLSLPVFGDVLWEQNETYSLMLWQPTNAVLAANEALGTIINDDPYPSLTARVANGSVVMEWAGGPYMLQGATNVSGPYLDLPAASSPYTNTVASKPGSFYRLRVP